MSEEAYEDANPVGRLQDDETQDSSGKNPLIPLTQDRNDVLIRLLGHQALVAGLWWSLSLIFPSGKSMWTSFGSKG